MARRVLIEAVGERSIWGRVVRAAGTALIALAASAATGCDTPPDIHVTARSVVPVAGEYVTWRVRREYRMRTRQVARVEPALSNEEVAPQFRVVPLGPLPEYERVIIDLERHAGNYRNAGPRRVRVITRFAPEKHLRLVVWFDEPPPRESGGVGGGGSGTAEECGVTAPNCRYASVSEASAANGPPTPIERGDVDEEETPWFGDPSTSPQVITRCVLFCDNLPVEDGSSTDVGRPPRRLPPVDAGMDAGPTAHDGGVSRDARAADVADVFDAADAADAADADDGAVDDSQPPP